MTDVSTISILQSKLPKLTPTMHPSAKKGFTLIELLVVISIIAILSIIGAVVFSGISSKARDAQRKHDLKSLSFAVEFYSRKFNSYPFTYSSCSSQSLSTFFSDTNLFPDTSTIPKDPKNSSYYCYISIGTDPIKPTDYHLYAKLENCSDSELIPDACAADWNYGIDSSGDTLKTGP